MKSNFLGLIYSTITFSYVNLGKLFYLSVPRFLYLMRIIGFTLIGDCWEDTMKDQLYK